MLYDSEFIGSSQGKFIALHDGTFIVTNREAGACITHRVTLKGDAVTLTSKRGRYPLFFP